MKYEELKPHEIETLLQSAPIAYIAWGSHEWHGPQNAIGLDTLKCYHLCFAACKETGGVVLPPVYCGYQTMKPCRGFAHCLEFSKETVQSLAEQYLEQLYDEGFRVMVIVMGHYGAKHVETLRAGVARFCERHYLPRVWAFPDYEATSEAGYGGDHAGINETSLLMHFRPDLVDMRRLPERPDGARLGLGPPETVRQATAERGAKIVQAFLASVVPKVKALLDESNAAHAARFGA